MALLTASILTEDDSFRRHIVDRLRSGATPVSIADERTVRGAQVDLIVVDGRHHHAGSLASTERMRVSAPSASIFMVAAESSPDVILQSMRAGANEFLVWPIEESPWKEAIGRAVARRSSSPSARSVARTTAFVGAKGGTGTTTVAVNFAVELARLTKRPTVIVDLKPGLGEVTLFLGVRSRYSLLDAMENLHRLDSEFLKELIVKHKSGLDILAGSEQFERPAPGDAAAVEEVLRLLMQQYEYVIIDTGNYVHACAAAALYTADSIYIVANPDVPCVRNAQRLLDRVGQLGACADRIRFLLNRASEPYPIARDQIENALGRPIDHTFGSDYRTVSTALNSGVPLSLTGNSDLAAQFDAFTRKTIDPGAEPSVAESRSALGLQRLASIW